MARKPRFNIPGMPQHVIQRGNNRNACFYDESDYRFYLECLAKASEKFDCDIHAYVLMTNHVHLLVTPHADYAVSQMMQSVGRRYVRYINRCYRRTGTLWEGRYKAALVDSERYLLMCSRYIELNPIRANIVDGPADYKWSSYRHNAFGELDDCVKAHPLYEALGADAESRQVAYRRKNGVREQLFLI